LRHSRGRRRSRAQPLDLLLKLLIAVLQFLDRAGQCADRAFQPLDARHKFR